MKRLFIVLLFFIHASLVIAQRPVDEIRSDFLDANSKNVLVASHRAAHLVHPENSIPAIKQAIAFGVDIIELDVKVTKDGVPVLMHDGTINRTSTGSGKPSDFTFQEIRTFRLIHKGDTTEEVIPTFEEALLLVKGHALIDIDIKTGNLDPIIEVIKKLKMTDHVFWFDNDYEALQYVRDNDPDFMLMPRVYSIDMADSAIVRFSPEAVHIDFSFYNPEVTQLIRSNNTRIWINALGAYDPAFGTDKEEEALDKILKYGANIIQTDQPELLLKALRKRGLHR